MGFQIEDGTGTGQRAGVTNENQVLVQAEIHELQHHLSRHKGQVYQIIGQETAVNNSTHTILHIKNTSSTYLMFVSYIRMQCMKLSGGTAIPTSETYFQMGFGRTYSSGGSAVTPVNMSRTSANIAPVTVYDDSPTLAGTFVEADRWYPYQDMMTFNKHGSLILGLNDTMEVRFTTDHTSGLAYARVTAMFLNPAQD